MEAKLETLFRDFEYHARETVNAVQDRAAAQKLSKEAERRIAKCGGNFASSSMPQSSRMPRAPIAAIPTRSEPGETRLRGDTVKLKSMGRAAVVKKKIGDDHFDVEIGSMKMRIHREDIAEVLATAQGNSQPLSSPVEAARSRELPSSCKTNSAT